MITKGDIEQFYKDVENLQLKFPVASIAKATGESKGNVSRILSRGMEPSESFLKKFYNGFENVPRGGVGESSNSGKQGGNIIGEGPTEIDYYKALLKAKEDILKVKEEVIEEKEARRQEVAARLEKVDKEKDRLYGIIESNLMRIQRDQDLALAYQKAWVALHADEVSGGNQVEKKKVMAKMGRLVGEYELGPIHKDNPSIPSK
jgi:transcriptional regulator with XRE-family HTH domain